MKIGLIDTDNHNKVKKHGSSLFPNLALCKISAYHKAKGDDVEWVEPLFGSYDRVYMAKIFNFTPEYPCTFNAKEIIKGGTGYDIYSKLPEEIDNQQPDYSIYQSIPADTSFGFLTRGCPNKCYWCVVPRKEGAIKPYWDIERVANGRKKVVLMDNNILAAGDYTIEQLNKIIKLGLWIDFNQALDARLVTEEKAKLLAKCKWIGRTIRFGCDTHSQIMECERAIRMINENGFKGKYFLYTMLNDNFNECHNRITYWWKRMQGLKKGENVAYPYAQPYRNLDKPTFEPPQWQKDMARWTNNKAIFKSSSFEDYEPRHGFKCKQYFYEF